MTDVNKPVVLEKRSIVGKGLNSLRLDGQVPAVIHNHGEESVHVMGPQKELDKVYQAAGKHHPLNLAVGTDKYLALIKDVHFNPVKRRIEHIVFQAIRQNEKVEAEIPIHIEGDMPAERQGLVVLHQLDTVQVEAFPRDLPDKLEVDGSKLAELHDKLTVADIKLPAGVTLITEEDHPVATVVETKAQMSEDAAEEETEGEEGEGNEASENESEGSEKPAEDKSNS